MAPGRLLSCASTDSFGAVLIDPNPREVGWPLAASNQKTENAHDVMARFPARASRTDLSRTDMVDTSLHDRLLSIGRDILIIRALACQ